MKRTFALSQYTVSSADLIRVIIIASLALLCFIIAIYSISRNLGTIYAQLLYFPIIYATYFYPRRGLYLAGLCAVIYECLAFSFLFPDLTAMVYVVVQALLFVCMSALVAYVREKLGASEAHNRTIVEKSPIGIILFDKNDHLIRLTNTRVEHLLGYSSDELVCMTMPDLFSSPDERDRFLKTLATGEEVRDFETALLSREHEPVWVNLSWNSITENLMSCTVVDINNFRRARIAAGSIDVLYKQVTDSLPTGIIIVRDQMVIYANPSFGVLSGYSPDDLLGKDPLTLINPDDHAVFRQACEEAESGSAYHSGSEINLVLRSGKGRTVLLYATRVPQLETPAVLINLVDLPERSGGRITQSSQQRGIISAFAYELRTPLQPIMGYINLLTQDPDLYGVTEETRLILDRCAKSVDRERQIINQMLELSLLDSEKVSLEYTLFSLPDLVRSVVDTGGYAKDAEITINISPDITFEADREKISTVIDTMVSNAVKYSTHPRRVHISYTSSPDENMHRLSIRDNGIGITDARLDEIFEPFQYPDSPGKTLNFDKIGLSLAIAKKYIKLHGGYISVDSIKNLETTFSIHIPKHRPAGLPDHG